MFRVNLQDVSPASSVSSSESDYFGICLHSLLDFVEDEVRSSRPQACLMIATIIIHGATNMYINHSVRANAALTQVYAAYSAFGIGRKVQDWLDAFPSPTIEQILQFINSNLINDLVSRKEAIRRQRIEAEHRRRDELRDGYAKLKDVLPVSRTKFTKVSLLDRASEHISVLRSENTQLSNRIADLEGEIRCLQALNEKLVLASFAPLSNW
ncbi:hypothetical protein DFH08DRAFT_877202 [Mycena albidolilacea]|uniref:BHLH domain-containing protein n=1 Tax=Mycena albidolilacea TaxID=1033008 RepID=A0AAD7EME6_9AGAR|nr:hypothetical protein DFH08DRAFT_877202 [Mycena albidolilacea]